MWASWKVGFIDIKRDISREANINKIAIGASYILGDHLPKSQVDDNPSSKKREVILFREVYESY